MKEEIERKFLARREALAASAGRTHIRQGYLCREQGRTVRVRTAGERAFLTVKGPARGGARAEFEYEIPLSDALQMMAGLCPLPPVEKTRHFVPAGGDLTWEVDEFHGRNAGLLVAEIELAAVDQTFERPTWLGEEVTADPRYLNANLYVTPFAEWPK